MPAEARLAVGQSWDNRRGAGANLNCNGIHRMTPRWLAVSPLKECDWRLTFSKLIGLLPVQLPIARDLVSDGERTQASCVEGLGSSAYRAS
jgi:hypothetical protein